MALPPPKRVKLEAFYPVWGRNNYPQWSGTRPRKCKVFLYDWLGLSDAHQEEAPWRKQHEEWRRFSTSAQGMPCPQSHHRRCNGTMPIYKHTSPCLLTHTTGLDISRCRPLRPTEEKRAGYSRLSMPGQQAPRSGPGSGLPHARRDRWHHTAYSWCSSRRRPGHCSSPGAPGRWSPHWPGQCCPISGCQSWD